MNAYNELHALDICDGFFGTIVSFPLNVTVPPSHGSDRKSPNNGYDLYVCDHKYKLT